jgi:DNA-binding beta-propeller fold protein YncE
MTFFTKMLWTMKSMVFSLLISTSFQSSQFIYLNNPETLNQTGILHKKKIIKNTQIRYFFHYKNGTKENQNFSIWNKKTVFGLRKSINISLTPEKAGYLSAKGFLLNNKTDSSLNFSCKLKPYEVVSGMIEGNFSKGDEVVYKFGESTELIETLEVIQSDFSFDIPLVLEKNKISSYRLGDGIPYTVRGQYGSDVIVNIKPKETGWMKLSFSPRGGTGALVFENKGKVYFTNFEKTKSYNDSSLIYVVKDKTEKIRFIPFGGLNYPIVLDFKYVEGYNPKVA